MRSRPAPRPPSASPSRRRPPGRSDNTAPVAADESDPNPGNDAASVSTSVSASADLAVAKSASALSVKTGDALTYTITVTNHGPSPATGVTLADALPAGMTLTSATPGQGSCGGTAPVTCALGTLAAGAGTDVVIAVVPTTPGTATNTATLTAVEADPVSGNNTASVVTTILARPAEPTAEQALQALRARVLELVATGALSDAEGRARAAKLDAALHALGRANATAARGQLQAFVNQVSALLRSNRLAAADGQALIDAATAIRAML